MEPQVRDLQATIQQLRSQNQGQFDLLAADEAGLGTFQAEQEKGLAAKQDTAFNRITGTANDRGALFSGFRPEEQAKYTAETYLPALAGLRQTIADSRRQIQGQRAGLDASISKDALGLVEADKTALQRWQENQAQMRAEQERLVQQQRFQAEQAALDRTFQANQNAANRAASAAKTATPKAPTISQIKQDAQININQELQRIMNSGPAKPGATEQVLDELIRLYPELSPADLSKMLYDSRKPFEEKFRF